MLRKLIAAAVVAAGLVLPAGALAAVEAVVTADLNIRTGPGTQYPRFGTVPYGSRVIVIQCYGSGWCDVDWSGRRGWVAESYLAYVDEGYYVAPPTVTVVPRAYDFWPDFYFYHRDRPRHHRHIRHPRPRPPHASPGPRPPHVSPGPRPGPGVPLPPPGVAQPGPNQPPPPPVVQAPQAMPCPALMSCNARNR